MNEFRNYTEAKKDLLSSLGLKPTEVLGVFATLKSATSTQTYKEGVKSPTEILKTLLNSCEEKLTKASLATYGEFESDGDDEDCATLSEFEPKGVVADEESVKLHKNIAKYCRENNLDPNNSNHYKEAYKAMVSSGRR